MDISITPPPWKMHTDYKERTKVTLLLRSLTNIILNQRHEVVKYKL